MYQHYQGQISIIKKALMVVNILPWINIGWKEKSEYIEHKIFVDEGILEINGDENNNYECILKIIKCDTYERIYNFACT